jgi:amidase
MDRSQGDSKRRSGQERARPPSAGVSLLSHVSTAFLPALEQARLIREQAVSPVEIVEEYVQRIERIDPVLNSYVTVCADQALAQARDPRPGPFSGVPLPIKDLAETAGIRTTYSCRAFADYVPAKDAALVRRIRDAGFIILGKTNTPEFGTTAVTESDLNGICRNPWNPSHTPGGSSGGAAAAVAAGLAPLAQGGDGAGSIRIPASCCGLFGIKPTRGRTSTAPFGNVHGFAVYGPIARTVADAAALLDVISGPEPGDPHAAPPPERSFLEEVGVPADRLRIALVLDPPSRTRVDPVCANTAREAGALLEELGHDVEEVYVDWGEDLRELFTVVWQTIPTLYVSDTSQLEPLNAALAARALATSSAEYLRGYSLLQQYGRRVAAFCAGYDVVLTPTLALPPVPVGWVREPEDPWEQYARAIEFAPFTAPVNVAGLPAVSIPISWTQEGLPVGVQLVASANEEPVLLRLCAQIEEARPWADTHPPGC